MDVELQYFEDCPNWHTAGARLAQIAAEQPTLTVRHRIVATPEEAEAIGFRGSPTILIDGHDAFAAGDEATGLACRIYQTPDGPAGAPTLAQLRDAVRT